MTDSEHPQAPVETPTPSTEGGPDIAGHRSGFVAIVGRPNAGKSTLMNEILGERLAITTPKPQTTRDRIKGIASFDDWQAVFVDTPGIHEAKTKLNKWMVDQAVGTLGDVDACYVMIDAPNWLSKPEKVRAQTEEIVGAVITARTPAIAVVNKVDAIKDKQTLLPILEAVSTMHAWIELVPISALTGRGVESLLQATRPLLPEGPALFPEDELTDRSLRFLAAEMIREQLFMQLGQELPYNVAASVEQWKEREDGLVEIMATVHVARKSHKSMVIGKGGTRVRAIGTKARRSLEAFLERRVYLDLRVRVEEDWTERADALRKFGYKD